MTTEAAPPQTAPPPPPPSPPPGYPIRYLVERPDKQSRLTNFPLFIGTFIRMVVAIPHFIILYFLQIAANIIFFIGTFAILFTGRYPLGLARFYAGYQRWNLGVTGYLLHLYDAYPRFSMDEGDYPLRFEVDYPERSSRILNFPIFGLIIKALLVVPHLFVLVALSVVALVVIFIAQFAILFTGSFPAGMHGFVVGTQRWSTRVGCYIAALTDRYPPFSLE